MIGPISPKLLHSKGQLTFLLGNMCNTDLGRWLNDIFCYEFNTYFTRKSQHQECAAFLFETQVQPSRVWFVKSDPVLFGFGCFRPFWLGLEERAFTAFLPCCIVHWCFEIISREMPWRSYPSSWCSPDETFTLFSKPHFPSFVAFILQW